MKKTAHHGSAAHSSPKHHAGHQAKGKHKGTSKHKASQRHRKGQAPAHSTGTPVHVVAKPPSGAKPRKLTPGDVALCPAEAVASAARMAGWMVSDRDVLDLYARVADGPSSGFTIAAALSQGWRLGVADFAPLHALDEVALPLGEPGQVPAPGCVVHGVEHVLGADRFHAVSVPEGRHGHSGDQRRSEKDLTGTHGPDLIDGHSDGRYPAGHRQHGVFPESHALILGVDLPGPHAVTVAPDGCWVSWGQHYDPADFPDAVIEEAWEVRWAA